MKVQEYQAKELFAAFDIPIEPHEVVDDPAEARAAAERIGGTVVVKAQVLVGGRGKAGGVKLAKTPEEAESAAREILGLSIKDIPVEKVMITPAAEIEQEYYIGLTTDRAAKQLILMMSKAGGVDIEELATQRPEEIVRFHIHPGDGIDEVGLAAALESVFETPSLVSQADAVVRNMYRLYREKDCSLVEINPFARVDGDTLKALDAKVNFDDNALYKHPDIEELRNPQEYSQDELDARAAGLSFVSMDGEIGCIVNGAGLAMATMDIIKLYGGTPANFLDVGGSSNPEKVLNALRIITRNPRVKGILINIFGGITRCDDIAKGILMAMEQIDMDLPMVIRLIGTNDDEGRAMLAEKGISAHQHLSEAVERVVNET
ncbi:MAG: ADP-forming succinate--CoA ligase subunit beta [Spirochaetaceae bacterium]